MLSRLLRRLEKSGKKAQEASLEQGPCVALQLSLRQMSQAGFVVQVF